MLIPPHFRTDIPSSQHRLALVTVMQDMEGLSDRQAAEAVRERIDWKYMLGLELTDPGFDFSLLAEFRARLLAGQAEAHLLYALLDLCKERGWLKARGRQRTDSTHALAAIRDLNRLECVGETLRHTLNVLAEVAPDWLVTQIRPEWFERYSRRFDEYRFLKPQTERLALAETIGTDGRHLLRAVYEPLAPGWLREVPAVETLRRSYGLRGAGLLARDAHRRWGLSRCSGARQQPELLWRRVTGPGGPGTQLAASVAPGPPPKIALDKTTSM